MIISINKLAAIIIILFASIYLYMSFNLSSGFNAGPVGSDVMPKIYGILLLILSIMNLIQKDDNKDNNISIRDFLNLGTLIVVLLIYAYLIEFLGFILSSYLVAAFVCYLFGGSLKTSLIASFFMTLLIVIVFMYILGISFPMGWIFKWI